MAQNFRGDMMIGQRKWGMKPLQERFSVNIEYRSKGSMCVIIAACSISGSYKYAFLHPKGK
jgi:hypothetical protein